MFAAYMSAHIRRMSRPVDAVGTIKPRQLAALESLMAVITILVLELLAALVASVILRRFVVPVDAPRLRPPSVILSHNNRFRNNWKQKSLIMEISVEMLKRECLAWRTVTFFASFLGEKMRRSM